MDQTIRSLYKEISERQGFQRDTVEIYAEVHAKRIQHHGDTNMNLVVITGGQRGLQLPHYHKQGFDFFVVMQGQGWLHTADAQNEQLTTEWHHQRVESGDCYSIDPYRAHCLLNDDDADLVFLNVSPAAHAGDDYFAVDTIHVDILRQY